MCILTLLTYLKACLPGWASAMLPIELHAISLCCHGPAMCGKHEPTPHDTRLMCDTGGMHNLRALWGDAGKAMHEEFIGTAWA